VSSFSKASARRFRIAYETRPEEFTQFVTLTFPREIFQGQSGLWQMSILKNFARVYWQEARKIPAKYLWVVEAQADGTPHFHVLVTGYGEKFAELWRYLVWCHLGYRHEDHEKYGTDVRPIMGGQIEAYLAKTCNYLVKTNEVAQFYPLLNGWRRWGRNYKSEPWRVEEAGDGDIGLGLYLTALQRRPNALITWCVFPSGVLPGVGGSEGDVYRQEVPDPWACSIRSGARLNPYKNAE
jgi:hypothetical protein